MLSKNAHDAHASYQCAHLTEDRFGVEPQLIAALAAYRVRLQEVPVSYHARSTSEGKKIGWQDGVRALLVIARGIRRTA